MFPLRAPSFTPASSRRLERVADWPRLPGIVLDRVVGVGIDSRGRVYVAHRGRHPLLRLNSDGTLDREIGAAHLHQSTAYDLRGPTPVPLAERWWLHGLHIDPRDNVWVTDVSRHLVFQFDPEGELVRTLGVEGKAGCDARHFNQPTHVTVLPSGAFFVTDGYGNSRVAAFDAAGNFLFDWGRRGTADGEFHTPHVVTSDPAGRLYLTDRENDRIQVFLPDGSHVATWAGLHSVDGLFSAPDGLLYASAGIDRALLRLDRSGKILDAWVRPDLFNYPHAIAVGPEGALYAADTGDRWKVTGPLPAEREMETRVGAEGSGVLKLFIR